MRKIFSLFAALTLSVGLWAANSVITFTSTSKLYPGSINEFMMENSKWEAFKVQYPEFASVNVFELGMMGVSFFNPNAFLDADGQVLNYTIDYDESTHAGTITFAGELVTMYGNDNTGVYAFYTCSSLTSITLPEGLTSIGEYSFRSCSSLASVTLPESLTTIADVAFANCTSLTSITIPANVTEIGYGEFISCSGLTDFYVAWTTTLPTIGSNLFLYASIGTATLHVPVGTKALYQNADQWKDFGNIVEIAPTPVSTTYLDENGETKNIDAFEVKDASEQVTWGTAGQTTWFVVNGTNVQLSKGAVCAGDVRLILADNAKLTATGWYDETYWIGYAGIQVSGDGNSLTIYAQSTGDEMGQLIATGNYGGGAGIGGGNYASGSDIVINGGIIEANGGEDAAGIGGGYAGSGSNIVINGGIIEANGGDDAAGIGGGEDGIGSNITINGGIITANGGDNGAGIGGGYEGSGSDITINGGEVTATGVDGGAGIGGGMFGYGSNITILAGTVEATGGMFAAGIGGGNEMFGSDITINGGTVTAYGGGAAAGIGGGNNGYGSNITILAGTVTATSEYAGAGIGGGENGFGSDITINGGTVTANGGEGAAGIGGGNSGTGSNIYISDAYVLKAGAAANPTDVIAHSSAQDIASSLNGKLYAKIEGLAMPYTRSMTIDNWATVCLPYASTVFSGAKFYRVNYYDGDTKLYIEEVSSLVAGQPYIFQATDETVTIEHAGVATLTYGEEQKDRGLQGLFARTIIATDGSQAALSNNAVQWLKSGLEITVPACRAYFDMNNVPDFEQTHSAPLRCIRVPRQTPTDFENVTLDEDATKILRNGQLIIIRDGKEYNAQGMQL